ncbi:MAG: isoprenylcysteine carboxylmethyltransferase family protein [Desulfosalsimonadaceae bacterium]|nr:isoprenylcysteine carboxylmethyltransferase family protein [Desulfosalsimonadaceae bacterium]
MKLNLKIPPLAQAAIAIFLIWLFDRYMPLYHINFNYQYLIARAVIGIGAIVAVAGIFAFRKLNTTVDPRYPEKAKNLVIVGIYKYSRNPMYLGLLLILTGIAVYSGALSNILVLFLFVAFINKYQIIPEEVALQEKFGDSYTHYTRNVRRWL